MAAKAGIGSKGLVVLPFGNGAERVLGNRNIGGHICNLNFNKHSFEHVLNATQEGIAFAFNYGIQIMKQLGLDGDVIRAGNANLFLSDLFRQALANTSDVVIELYDTDGAKGAALGAGVGAGIYSSVNEALYNLKLIDATEPDPQHSASYQEAYNTWSYYLNSNLGDPPERN